ncbi:MAG: PLDc N-terminal domain-containing protein, partial [Bacteroidaceae bacterium]|nr:PLDc N-terminal domain-containing protein [Bacteroidaceae bacterium]
MLTHVLFWIGASVYVILVVSMVFIVLLENRQPEKTIAWVVAIVLLPVIGPIAFIFFGQTIKRTRYINRHRYFQITSSML